MQKRGIWVKKRLAFVKAGNKETTGIVAIALFILISVAGLYFFDQFAGAPGAQPDAGERAGVDDGTGQAAAQAPLQLTGMYLGFREGIIVIEQDDEQVILESAVEFPIYTQQQNGSLAAIGVEEIPERSILQVFTDVNPEGQPVIAAIMVKGTVPEPEPVAEPAPPSIG